MTITRRQLLNLAAGAGLATRFASADDLMINSANPKDFEMTLAGFNDWITPNEHFFVRCHHYTPDVKLSEWSLKIDGVVDHPLSLRLHSESFTSGV